MGSTAKVSKKEKKAASFKAGKGKRGKQTALPSDLPENDLLDDDGVAVDGVGADADADGERGEAASVVSAVKKGKRKEKAPAPAEEPAEAEDSVAQQSDAGGKKKKRKADVAAEPEEAAEASTSPAAEESSSGKKSKKRKRGEDAGEDASAQDAEAAPAKSTKPKAGRVEGKAKRTTFGEDGETAAVEQIERKPKEDDKAEDKADKKGKAKAKEEGPKKYIVFVGNMSYKTSSDEIAAHFESHCGEKPSVRLLTTKADPNALAKLSKSKQKSIAKGKASHAAAGGVSKGCAFVEFSSTAALQKALQFHHTLLAGRQINVELTAGGGGKTAARTEKITKKNEKLDKQRQKLHEKYVAPKAASKKDAAAKDGTQQPPAAKKQKKDAGASAEEGAAQWSRQPRGGAAARGKPMPKWMASGANAVRLQG